MKLINNGFISKFIHRFYSILDSKSKGGGARLIDFRFRTQEELELSGAHLTFTKQILGRSEQW